MLFRCFLLLSLVLAQFAEPLSATSLRLAPIADTTISRPGGGTFDRVAFGYSRLDFDALGDRTVFVHSQTPRGVRPEIQAIYLVENGQIDKLVETGAPVPGGSGSLVGFSQPRVLTAGVAFVARDSAGRDAIYRIRNGVAEVLIDEADLGQQIAITKLASTGQKISLINHRFSSTASIHLMDSATMALSLVARAGDSAPDGSSFTSFRYLRMSEEVLVFSAETTLGIGIFAAFHSSSAGLGLQTVVNQGTVLPGSRRTYDEPNAYPIIVQPLDVHGSTIAFVQNAFGPAPGYECIGGVFSWQAGNLSEVVSNHDTHPVTHLPFSCFYDVVLADEQLFFRATTFTINGGPGVPPPSAGDLLRHRDNRLDKLLGFSEKVNGMNIYNYHPVFTDARRAVLFANGSPNSEPSGLYELDFLNAGLAIPTLSSISLIVFTVLLALVAVRRI